MPSGGDNAVYNARILYMRASLSRLPRAVCVLLLIVTHAPMALAGDWRAPEEQMARKIAAATGPGAVALEVVNRSSLGHADVGEIQRELIKELASLGLRMASADQAAATVRITLSENLQNFVWVAEVHQGNNEVSVLMVSVPRSSPATVESSALTLTIRKTLLWVDENRMLDVVVVSGNPQHMIILEPENAVLFKFQDGRWQPEQTLPISHVHPWPRDLRGRLALRKDHLFDAFLPGVFCRSSTAAPLALNCYESDDPWPLGADQSGLSAFFAPTRNFFTGALAPGIDKQTNVKAFFSAAMLPREKYRLWIFVAVDGQVHLLDGLADQTVPRLGWGSDITSVRSGCGLGWQVLATAGADSTGESMKAFEIADREPLAVSQPLEFAGNITALWPDSDGASATAVVQNIESGKYEAYRLSIACGQ
jgi:hypothetical protein